MKLCKYVKCQKPHSRKSAYCCPAHKTRQWEINNGKKPFLEGKNDERLKAFHVKQNLTSVLMEHLKDQKSNTLGSNQMIKETLVKNKPSQLRNQLALTAALANILIGDDIKPKNLLWWTAGAYGVGLIIDALRPKHSIQQTIVDVPIISSHTVEKKQRVHKPRMSSAEYRELNIPRLGLTGQYQDLFGDPSKDFYMVVDGRPGHGKSYWVAQLAQHIHSCLLYTSPSPRDRG